MLKNRNRPIRTYVTAIYPDGSGKKVLARLEYFFYWREISVEDLRFYRPSHSWKIVIGKNYHPLSDDKYFGSAYIRPLFTVRASKKPRLKPFYIEEYKRDNHYRKLQDLFG